MAKYHINPETGEPGECKAEIKCRFGSPEEHYTSAEAARKAFEDSQPLFPPQKREETEEEILDRVRTWVPGERLSKEVYEALPVGAIIVQVHNESGDQSYFSIGEDRRVRAVSRKRMIFAVDDASLFGGGSRPFYVAESPLETELTVSQLENAWNDQDNASEEIASQLHENWRKERNYEPRIKVLEDGTELDIAGVGYRDLPEQWQRENHEAAKGALKTLRMGVANHWTRAQLGDSIHRSWLERNGEWAPEEQKLPYSQLSHEEQLKDLVVLETAAEVISSYPRGTEND